MRLPNTLSHAVVYFNLATVNNNLVTLNITGTLQSKHSSTFSSPLFLRKTLTLHGMVYCLIQAGPSEQMPDLKKNTSIT